MKLNSYLSKSRHGIFYFRYPLPRNDNQPLSSRSKLSLRTRCPEQAIDIARLLCAASVSLNCNQKLATMRHDELRKAVHDYYSNILRKRIEMFNRDGVPEGKIALLQSTVDLHDDFMLSDDLEMLDSYIDYDQFKLAAGVPAGAWDENLGRIKRELQKGYGELLKSILVAAESANGYDFSPRASKQPKATASNNLDCASPIGLEECLSSYLSEHKKTRRWVHRTYLKKEATLKLLIEMMGKDKPVASIDKSDARKIKEQLLELPVNRNKLASTRNLPLAEAILVSGIPKISANTINDYIGIFHSFFDWVFNSGYTEINPFQGMKVRTGRKSNVPARSWFDDKALSKIYHALASDNSKLVKKESHKWASLIGLFTGARLNEICQLRATDIKQEDGVWFFDITDEGDSKKSLKNNTSRRKVPIHSKLLELDILAYREEMLSRNTQDKQLFPDYNYCPKNGYGRSLSRWFNNQFTPALSIKSKTHVFHSFRHSMITKLAQAGVDEPKFQTIVGHERKGVSQQVYFTQGYTLVQLKETVEKFEIR